MGKTDSNEFNGCKVLVVGGAGFVGSNLVKILIGDTQNISVTIVDNLMSAERINIPDDSRVQFIEGSIADDGVLAQIADTFDYIFHLATYHGNQSSIHDPIADHDNNTITTLKLLEHTHKFKNLRKLVYSSAGCSVAKKTFDDAEATTEEDPISLEQDSPYSLSKIFGEFYCFYYYRQYQMPTVRARFQNVYGPGEILGAGQWRGTPATVWRNVTPTFIYKALNGQPLPVQNEGVATRDFIYVEDICRGLMACALKGGAGSVYNLASGRETSILQLATQINELTGNEGGIEYLPKRGWDNSGKRYGCADKAKKELDYSAEVELLDGLQSTIAWFKENADIINSCISKHDHHMSKL